MSRFDTFEKTIQATIKEEIKVNTVGLQKQVKSLTNKVKEVESSISTNSSKIEKINQKVANLDNLQEIIESEVQKQVSQKVASLEQDLVASQAEIATLKEAKSKPSSKDSDNQDTISRREFMKEQYFNCKRNLMLMGVGTHRWGR